jgi:hypothetical protein
MGLEVYLSVFYADFLTNVVSVKVNGSGGKIQDFGNGFGSFALPD